MAPNWRFEDGVYGLRMVMLGAWSKGAANVVESEGVRELELNYAKGWSEHDYSFLSQLSGLEALEIIDWNATDITPIHHLSDLKLLSVSTYCKTAIDFSRFPKLEDCSLEWRARARSVFEHTGIKKLFINKFSGKDLCSFEKMTLDSLSLASPKLESFNGVHAIQGLGFLGVYVARRLSSLSDLEGAPGLTHLEVNDCPKVHDLSALANLRNLEELHLCNNGEIDTFRPLAGHSRLRVVFFYESTNVVDGDLGVLKALPSLEDVAFMDRPHYSHRVSELPRRVST